MITSLAAIAAFVAACISDRLCLQRGKVHLINISNHNAKRGMLRFALDYEIKSAPKWAAVSYQLVNKEHPTTVIQGKARPLAHFKSKGRHSEYLLVDQSMVAPGTWELRVTIESTSSHINPSYKLCPVSTSITQEFSL